MSMPARMMAMSTSAAVGAFVNGGSSGGCGSFTVVPTMRAAPGLRNGAYPRAALQLNLLQPDLRDRVHDALAQLPVNLLPCPGQIRVRKMNRFAYHNRDRMQSEATAPAGQ